MEVYRITHSKWATKLEASGYAARWNSHGLFVIYAAENISLACLENLVHRNGFGLDADFSLITISIPDEIAVSELRSTILPSNWNELNENAHLICRKYGDNWIKSQKTSVLIVPSAIIENEKNIIINVNHPDFLKIKISKTQPFSFDKRFSK
jgi:RES domain-containing protein